MTTNDKMSDVHERRMACIKVTPQLIFEQWRLRMTKKELCKQNLEVGEVFEFEGKKYEVKEPKYIENSCIGCAMYKNLKCPDLIKCVSPERIFVEVEG